MKITRTALATLATPLLLISACASDSATTSAPTSTVTQTVNAPTSTPITNSAQVPTSTPPSSPPTSSLPTEALPPRATDRPAEDFLVADGIYTVALDEGRGCNFHPEYWSCGVVASMRHDRPTSGGMLGVQLRQNGFNTYEVGGQPFANPNLAPGQSVTIKGATITHQTDGTMRVDASDFWFQVHNGHYTSNLATPAARGETVNAGQVCGDFLYGMDGYEHAEIIAGVDGVDCGLALERISSYYTPQINNSPYGPGEGDVTLRGGSKCTDKHMVDGQATQACTGADGSQLAYLKRY